MRVYYAHCIAIYSTPQEDRDVFTLESMGFEVVNPNSSEVRKQVDTVRENHKNGAYAACRDVGEAIMHNVFKPLVSATKCDVVAFRGLPDGRIPAGVAREIMWAHDNGVPVFELPSNFSSRVMSVASTREYLREIGAR